MKISESAFMPICWVAAILSMVFIAQIITAGRPSPSGAAVAQPSAPTETAEERESRNAAFERGQTLLRERGLQQGGPSIRYRGTAEGSIICSSLFNLKEAGHARFDEKWLKSLDCVRAKPGLPVVILEDAWETGYLGYKIRVTLPGGEGLTVWTNYSPVDYCGGSPCPPIEYIPPPVKPKAINKPETGTSARWVCQKTTIVNRDGSSPTTCGFQTLPEDTK